MDPIKCKTCDTGTMIRKKKYRMSGVVVTIGYILLIPSIFGMLVGVVGLLGSGMAGSRGMQAFRTRAESNLRAANVPVAVITKVTTNPHALATSDTAPLSGKQRAAIRNTSLSLAASNAGTTVGAGLAAGFSIFFIILSLVGGLLGWLLIMKKRVLQCDRCGAIVAAG